MPTPSLIEARDVKLLALMGLLLTVIFISGGSSQQSGVGVLAAQLLAIPILLYSLLQAWQTGRLRNAQLGVGALVLVVMVPWLQLLPIPSWLWDLPSTRLPLQHDLMTAGVDHLDTRWSLAPAATERAALLLLPPMAVFFAVFALGRDALRKVLWLVIVLALFSLVLAVAQAGAGQDSFLNPFPEYLPAMAGVFANVNHQADTLAVALVISVALIFDARRQVARHGGSFAPTWILVALAAVFALALPLIGSRAGVLIVMLPLAMVAVLSSQITFERLRHHRPTQLSIIVAILLLVATIFVAWGWMQVDSTVGESRWVFSKETLQLGFANAPLGGGVGSFVPLFEHGAEVSLRLSTYLNHAHDEYAQWWLEAGILGLVVLLAVLTTLAVLLRRLIQLPRHSRLRGTAVAALAAMLIMLLHSSVDYPLRTPALMAVFAALAGIFTSATQLVPGQAKAHAAQSSAGPRRTESAERHSS
jgi:hypothetical protein